MAYKTVPSSWLQLSLRTNPAAFDAVSNFLIERGSPGVVIKGNEVQAYFPGTINAAALRQDVQRFVRAIERVADAGKSQLRWQILKDRNWNSAWRRFFHPQRVGRRFLITPPWIKPERVGRRYVITIEPGMAFGTGTHATTRGCIEFLEQAVSFYDAAPFSALDVGTGSGILAIVLAKLGAGEVVALDNDRVALKVARKNLALNRVQKSIRLSDAKLAQVAQSFHFVVANLTAETILDLANALAKRVSPGGFLILAGIIYSQVGWITDRFIPAGFKVVKRRDEREWATLLLRKQEMVQKFKNPRPALHGF